MGRIVRWSLMASALVAVVGVAIACVWWQVPDPRWPCVGSMSDITCEPVSAEARLSVEGPATGGGDGVATTAGGRTATVVGDTVVLTGGTTIPLPVRPGARVSAMRFGAGGRTLLVAREWDRGTWRDGPARNRPGGEVTAIETCFTTTFTVPVGTPVVRLEPTETPLAFTARLADGSVSRYRMGYGDLGFFAGTESCPTGWPRRGEA